MQLMNSPAEFRDRRSISALQLYCRLAMVVLALSGGSLVDGRRMSAVERQLFLDEHNRRRSELAVAAPAADIKKLKYDMDLEAQAQSRADKCIYEHNTKELSPKGSTDNLFFTTYNISAVAAIREAVHDWWAESENYKYTDPYNYTTNAVTTHYTQAAWANTSRIGCGIRTDCRHDINTNKIIVICNYNYRGNFVGERFYEVGPACSHCATGYTCDRKTHLCDDGSGEGIAGDGNVQTRENTGDELGKNTITNRMADDSDGRRPRPNTIEIEKGGQNDRVPKKRRTERSRDTMDQQPMDRNGVNRQPRDRNGGMVDRQSVDRNGGTVDRQPMDVDTADSLRSMKEQIAKIDAQMKQLNEQLKKVQSHLQQRLRRMQKTQPPLQTAHVMLRLKQQNLHFKDELLREKHRQLREVHKMLLDAENAKRRSG